MSYAYSFKFLFLRHNRTSSLDAATAGTSSVVRSERGVHSTIIKGLHGNSWMHVVVSTHRMIRVYVILPHLLRFLLFLYLYI